uniref:Carboxysome shell protein n=1 Tax=Paulinella chromatophora TaxID=39717 RepID=A6YIN1_PAUCH|nr:carboxysome shell protein [Paulinella chromatophora]ABS00403.1 carboxysome shell protein [Paulinella chromatophora]ACB43319.1 carboxysome shell protein [Paulinella chromatophora]
MARTSSREAALERRKALTTSGKKAASQYTATSNRVRSTVDARPSRTSAELSIPKPSKSLSKTVAISRNTPRPITETPTKKTIKIQHNPSRELVLARRQALSRRGKKADHSQDRTRSEVTKKLVENKISNKTFSGHDQKCKCQDKTSSDKPSLRSRVSSVQSVAIPGRSVEKRSTPNRKSILNNSRALVLARREAQARYGKSAKKTSNSSASLVRQSNPDLTTRELAQRVRELRSKSGAIGTPRNGNSRPTGPRRGTNKLKETGEVHLKVGVSETSRGQLVTGTQANRSIKTTGNEASTCRTITGTEYLGSEIFKTFCKSEPIITQPPKVGITVTSHGNKVTGNKVGRSERVTGDEPGTCKNVTGTEYISANQVADYCNASIITTRKVGKSQTFGGHQVSGVIVGSSEKVTGNEAGASRYLTGDQYLGIEPNSSGRSATKVSSLHTLKGTGITGTNVGRSRFVTGDEPGTCRRITGDEYIGAQQYQEFCDSKPMHEAPKVGFSITNKAQIVSGTKTGRSEKVTGDEPGTCKTVTGTPYAGLEQTENWCRSNQIDEIKKRTLNRAGTSGHRLSGIQPGIGGVMTGAERGVCESITGTPYIGTDQLNAACGAANNSEADFPQPLGIAPWQQFSIPLASPARLVNANRQERSAVTGISYEQGSRITGPFDIAGDKVTGTEQFRFDRRGMQARTQAKGSPIQASKESNNPISRVTGEGISAGLKITGDDWDRGEHVTGTEGVSARRRNPTRPGLVGAMTTFQPKRNSSVQQPISRVTGSSGNTNKGSLITVSGGARG